MKESAKKKLMKDIENFMSAISNLNNMLEEQRIKEFKHKTTRKTDDGWAVALVTEVGKFQFGIIKSEHSMVYIDNDNVRHEIISDFPKGLAANDEVSYMLEDAWREFELALDELESLELSDEPIPAKFYWEEYFG